MLHHPFTIAWTLAAAFALAAMPLREENRVVSDSKPPIKWVVKKSSTLKVTGKSNVNEFTCDIGSYYGPDTLAVSDNGSGKAVLLTGCLEIDIFKFDCGSRMITKDLRNTLKAEDYPKLTIRFLTLDRMPNLNGNAQYINGWVEVSLAGTRKTFQIPYEFIKKGNGTYVLNGKRIFCFSDFKLTPPTRLAGAIKVKDEFAVDFQLNLTSIQ